MTPEEKARQKIDQWFAEAGWKVINREDYEPTCTAVAIREGLLKGNLEADYFLFINGTLMVRLLVFLRPKGKMWMRFPIRYVSRRHYMPKAFLIYIRHIRTHCLLFLLPMGRICISVISASRSKVSNR